MYRGLTRGSCSPPENRHRQIELEGPSPTSSIAKAEARRIRNRLSAIASRKKKMDVELRLTRRIAELELQVKQLKEENDSLQAQRRRVVSAHPHAASPGSSSEFVVGVDSPNPIISSLACE